MRYLVDSATLQSQWTVGRLLQGTLTRSLPADAMLAWGRKPSALRAERRARALGLPLLRIEDGFIRSFGTSQHFPSLSLVSDSQGIYYDSTTPSDLETWLNEANDGPIDVITVESTMQSLLKHRLSKYNHAPPVAPEIMPAGQEPIVLVLDQTLGDMSVLYGSASSATFARMLQAAVDENPGSQVWVKTHPEVSSGRKRGYLTHVREINLPLGGRLHTIRQTVNPIDLLRRAYKVYAVTSGMGFEALLCGKPVRCFGLPWYAGWGLTTDEECCPRRTRTRTVSDMFHAAYLRYTRYLNPLTHQMGSIHDVIQWLVHQRTMARLHP